PSTAAATQDIVRALIRLAQNHVGDCCAREGRTPIQVYRPRILRPLVPLVIALLFFFDRPSFCQPTDFERACAGIASEPGNDAARLQKLFRLDWDYTMREDPETATENGYPGQNHRWSDQSLA